jgi:hypothetical protein
MKWRAANWRAALAGLMWAGVGGLWAAEWETLYFMDGEGRELMVQRDDEAPWANLRVPGEWGARGYWGHLEGQQGVLVVVVPAPGTEDVEEGEGVGIVIEATHDPEMARMEVSVRGFGKTPVGLIPEVPEVGGVYVRVGEQERVRVYRAEHEAAERALGEMEERVKGMVARNVHLARLMGEQAAWKEGRGAEAAVQLGFFDEGEAEEAALEERGDYWMALADATWGRGLLLLAASGLEAGEGMMGTYIDGHGGWLEVLVVGGDGAAAALDFSITVVRGPTAHTGQLAGLAEFQDPAAGDVALFVDEDEEAFWEGKPAKVRFGFDGHSVKVDAENTHYYHGARAYFDGVYFKLPAGLEE